MLDTNTRLLPLLLSLLGSPPPPLLVLEGSSTTQAPSRMMKAPTIWYKFDPRPVFYIHDAM